MTGNLYEQSKRIEALEAENAALKVPTDAESAALNRKMYAQLDEIGKTAMAIKAENAALRAHVIALVAACELHRPCPHRGADDGIVRCQQCADDNVVWAALHAAKEFLGTPKALCPTCNAPMDDGKLHSIPGNNTELCSHIKGM